VRDLSRVGLPIFILEGLGLTIFQGLKRSSRYKRAPARSIYYPLEMRESQSQIQKNSSSIPDSSHVPSRSLPQYIPPLLERMSWAGKRLRRILSQEQGVEITPLGPGPGSRWTRGLEPAGGKAFLMANLFLFLPRHPAPRGAFLFCIFPAGGSISNVGVRITSMNLPQHRHRTTTTCNPQRERAPSLWRGETSVMQRRLGWDYHGKAASLHFSTEEGQ